MLVFKFHENRRQNFFWLRRVPPLDFSVFDFKSGFLTVESLQLQWQLVFLMNSECPNIHLLRKINRPHGIFCFIEKLYSTLWYNTHQKNIWLRFIRYQSCTSVGSEISILKELQHWVPTYTSTYFRNFKATLFYIHK